MYMVMYMYRYRYMTRCMFWFMSMYMSMFIVYDFIVFISLESKKEIIHREPFFNRKCLQWEHMVRPFYINIAQGRL